MDIRLDLGVIGIDAEVLQKAGQKEESRLQGEFDAGNFAALGVALRCDDVRVPPDRLR